MKKSPISSILAPSEYPEISSIPGVVLSVANSGMTDKKNDLLLVSFADSAQVAGIFTKSQTPSASVEWCKNIIEKGKARGLIVNAGNANAFTGYEGVRNMTAIVASVSNYLKCRADEIFVAATGVIGDQLPINDILKKIPLLQKNLFSDKWYDAADAIRTTDTYPKMATASYLLDGNKYTLNGIAKGSGMIAPDMATMLGFLFTDSNIPADILSWHLKKINAVTFNAITVDSDTSTSDTVLLFSTAQGISHKPVVNKSDRRLSGFLNALNSVMRSLAKQIVCDGEGATKFVSVNISGASSTKAAKIIAKSIANSPLVKTAIYGEDPNWGRIVMAVGKSGEKVDRDKLKILFGDILVAEHGNSVDNYEKKKIAQYMKRQEININVDLGIGRGSFTVWTCDLSEKYIQINSYYRT